LSASFRVVYSIIAVTLSPLNDEGSALDPLARASIIRAMPENEIASFYEGILYSGITINVCDIF
jgi:hypothetical protein